MAEAKMTLAEAIKAFEFNFRQTIARHDYIATVLRAAKAVSEAPPADLIYVERGDDNFILDPFPKDKTALIAMDLKTVRIVREDVL